MTEKTDTDMADLEVEDKLHEDIADIIASYLGTELKKASKIPAEKNSAKDNDHDNSEILPENNNLQAFSSSTERQLLTSLEKQTSRIHELEEKLEALQSISTHFNQAEKPSGLHAISDNNPNENRLIVSINGGDSKKYRLSKNIMTIGREPKNNIQIRSRYISRFHARIVSDKYGSTIEDMGSRNGIAINAKKAHRTQLKSGDLIDLGKIQLKYIDLMEDSASEGQA
ncbi:MAG: FHA domain-containing protein [Gammaproteobacteria bacterium]|nr:FHA domain-containing protein [Gammaproteobacteria bacterium]MCP4091175.1 FHA domain-containing protein [Gammaproteobacteria bacterium]MCP4831640.1 FHA domain-containing protein [Gammaproteobacteria bacterium]MCP4927863.1 FHA domain-containing protein [Gammaproteobacteria bacterium]